MTIKIISTYTPMTDCHLGHFAIDLTRKTAVLIRQSMKKADKAHFESRLLQENLIPIAIKIRKDEDDRNILVFDEGAGVSGTKGYDEREKLSALYLAIANDIVGSLLVARPDRLFRDKHFLNVGMFTELAERKKLILIVPGKRIYDFTKYADLQAFQKDMQEAYSYIATHVKYMNDARDQKQRRGLYGGGGLPAPYVIDRTAWKEEQIPIIYQPWLEPALDLFVKFRAYDFSIAHLCRYIESKRHIFPTPDEEDVKRYLFLSRMHLFNGGYSFSDTASVKEYLSNLTLGGYARVGKDEEGTILFMPNAFDAAIPYELLDEVYAAITGHHIDGTPFEGRKNVIRYMRCNPQGPHALFHGLLTSNQGHIAPHVAGNTGQYDYQCFQELVIDGHRRKLRFLTQSVVQWCLRSPEFDSIVLDRLFALSEQDSQLADRVKQTFASLKGKGIDETNLLQEQIDQTKEQIERYDFLLTDTSIGLDKETAKIYAANLAELRPKLARLLKKLDERPDVDPAETITNFYFVLSHLATEFLKQGIDVQKQMMTKLVKQITVDKLSPHLYSLFIVWQDGIAHRPDVALLWRGSAVREKEGWSEEEEHAIRTYWPQAHPFEVMQYLPTRSIDSIANHAIELGVRRTVRTGGKRVNTYDKAMTYADLQAAISQVAEEDGAYICGILNEMAETTKRGEITAYWPLPVDKVGFSTIIADDGGNSAA